MNKKYYAVVMLICLVLLVSACNKSGAATGGAPKTPFIGGTAGVTINFEKDFMLFLHDLKLHVDEEGGKTIDSLLDDEIGHFKKLFNLKEKIKRQV